MVIEEIKKNLEQRFSEPLPEYYKRRVIFWDDEEKEFAEEINELELSNAKALILKDNNNFEIKKILSYDDLSSNFLIYNSFDTDLESDWLLDIKLYSEEFRADQISLWMQEMHIEPTPALRSTIKIYKGFLNAASRRKLLSQFGEEINTPTKLHLAVLASICNVRTLNPKDIIKAVMSDGNDIANNLKMRMLSYNASDTFWAMVNKTTGYVSEGVHNIDDMDIHIVLSALTKTMEEKHLVGLEKRYNSFHNGFCYEMIYEWLHSDKKGGLIEVLRFIEKELHLVDRFNNNEINDLVDTEILPCIDEVILNKMMKQIIDNTINADEVISTIEKRRTMVWYKENENYYSSLMQVAYMQKFHDKFVAGFHHTNGKDIWQTYVKEYYLMDTYYRKFHIAFAKNLTDSKPVLDDNFRNLVDKVESL